jgi:hypothetical protein
MSLRGGTLDGSGALPVESVEETAGRVAPLRADRMESRPVVAGKAPEEKAPEADGRAEVVVVVVSLEEIVLPVRFDSASAIARCRSAPVALPAVLPAVRVPPAPPIP